jgi:hypothetical protein
MPAQTESNPVEVSLPATVPTPEVESKPAEPKQEEFKPEESKPEVESSPDLDLDKLFGSFVPPSDFNGAEFRQWIDNTGAYAVKARLSVIYVDKIKLLKENGKFTTVPLSRLSERDFSYVQWVANNLTGEQTSMMVKKDQKVGDADSTR